MANYESKPDDPLKDLKMPFGTSARREGIAIFDVDPESDTYGDILIDIPLPPDLVAHHVAYTQDGEYAFVQNSFINLPDAPQRFQLVTVKRAIFGSALS